MQHYVFEGRRVQAVQWLGQPLPGVAIEQQRWGSVGVIETSRGNRWLSEGDWMVEDGDNRRVVSAALFDLHYQAA